MYKRFLVLSALVLCLGLIPASSQAALIIQIDIGNDGLGIGDVNVTIPGEVDDFGPLPFVATQSGLTVTAFISTMEDPDESVVTHAELAVSGSTAVTQVRFRLVWSGIDLPAGSPLLLTSSISTSIGLDADIASTHTSTLDGLPVIPPLTASVQPPNELSDSDDAFAVVDRNAAEFTLEGVTILNFDPGTVFVNATASTIASAVPEAGSLVAWGSVLALAGVVGVIRKRRQTA